ncbi:MAG: DUF4920 domain-containing protein [Acidobacteriota bacterium]
MTIKTLHRNTKSLCLWLGCTLLLSWSAIGEETSTYGNEVSLSEATPIAKILADPDAFIGREVRVEGGVIDVCPRKGCWIEVGDEGESIRIKVEDDVIVFPAGAKGRVAAAQGTVEAIEMSRQQYLGWLAHLAEEKGEAFDAASADIGEGPFRRIQIRGEGAEIK